MLRIAIKNKTIIQIMIITILVFVFLVPVRVMAAQPQVTAEAAILIDMQNGQIIFQKNKDEIMFPASTTKILTTFIAIKKGNL